MSNFRNQSFTNYIASLSFKDGSIWKATKKALKEKPSYPPLKAPNNTWAIEDPVKADLFKTHLAEVFKPHNNMNNPAFSNKIEQFLLSPLQMTLPLQRSLLQKSNIALTHSLKGRRPVSIS